MQTYSMLNQAKPFPNNEKEGGKEKKKTPMSKAQQV